MVASGNTDDQLDTLTQLGLDELDYKIISELINDPDASSSQFAQKFGKPLSTIQRRRAKLEASVIKKRYHLNPLLRHHRSANLLIDAKSGNANKLARLLYERYPQITRVVVGINSMVNIDATVFFKTTLQLHDIMQEIAAMPSVKNVTFFEVTELIGEREISPLWRMTSQLIGE